MAIQLEANYSKKLGLPGYSSHQYSVTIRLEVSDIKRVETESARIYALLQGCVDRDIQETGFLPVHGSSNGNGTSNGSHRNGSNGYAVAGALPNVSVRRAPWCTDQPGAWSSGADERSIP